MWLGIGSVVILGVVRYSVSGNIGVGRYRISVNSGGK